MEQEIYKLLLQMNVTILDMQTGIQQIHKRLDVIEQRMDTLEQRMDTLEQRMDTLEQRMNQFEREMNAHDQQLRQQIMLEEKHYNMLQQSIGDSYEGLYSLSREIQRNFNVLDEKKVDKEALRNIG